jgi:hypothetical protein
MLGSAAKARLTYIKKSEKQGQTTIFLATLSPANP